MKILRLGAILAICLSANLNGMNTQEQQKPTIWGTITQFFNAINGFDLEEVQTDPEWNTWQSEWREWTGEWCEWTKDSWEILKAAAKNPKEIAEFSASSPCLQTRLLHQLKRSIKEEPEKQFKVLDIGSGTGILASKIAKMIGKNGIVRAIEPDTNLSKFITTRLTREKLLSEKVTVHNCFFSDFKAPETSYTHIICTVPFTRLSYDIVKNILDKSLELLEDNGTFTFESLITARTLGHIAGKLGIKTEQEYKDFCNTMELLDTWEYNSTVFTVRRSIVWCNVTPIWVHHLTKKAKKIHVRTKRATRIRIG